MENGASRPPIWKLVELAATELPSPMSLQDIVDWCGVEYPDVAQATLRAQVASVTGNLQSYLNHPVFSQRPPILWSIGYSQYEPYDETTHGLPAREASLTGLAHDDPGEEVFEQTRPPVWQLLAQAGRELVPPFTAPEVVEWFAQRYPDVLESTIRTQMSDWAGNSPAYMYNPAYNRRAPVLWRVARGQYEPYDSRRHGEVRTVNTDPLEEDAEDAVEAAQDFILEQYLEEFLHSNWDRVDFGRPLELWSPDGRSPRQFDAGEAGRMDFLCRDPRSDAIVVVELKRSTPSDSVVGQTLRYMGWAKAELARPEQSVEGIIVVGEADTRLRLAVATTPALRVMTYSIDFNLRPTSDAP